MASTDDLYRSYLRLNAAAREALLAHASQGRMRESYEDHAVEHLRVAAMYAGFDLVPRSPGNGCESIGDIANRIVSRLAKASPEVAAAYAESGYIHTRDYVAAVTEKSGGDEGAENSRGVDQPAIHHHPV